MANRQEQRLGARRVWDAIQRGELPDDERLRGSDFYDLLCEDDSENREEEDGEEELVIYRCSPHHKEAFTSEERALARLEEVKNQDRAGSTKTPYRAYYDPACEFWHLTSESKSIDKILAE